MAAAKPDAVEVFTLTDTLKEIPFNADPRRHFHDRKQAMYDHLIAQLTERGCLQETLVPTGKPNEFTVTLTLRALK